MNNICVEQIDSLSPEARRAALIELLEDRAEPKRFPLSFAQERLWFLDQLQPGNPAYNMPGSVRIKGALDVSALERAIREIVSRHEILRTSFESAGGKPVQVVDASRELRVGVVDLGGLPGAMQENRVAALAAGELRRPFDLAHGPLLRVTLIRLSRDEHVLLFTTHHIVSDAWSLGVIVEELGTLYRAYSTGCPPALPELSIQYRDYAVWQRQSLTEDVLKEHAAFWREYLAGAPELLELPTDRPRPRQQTFVGATFHFKVPSDRLDAFKRLCLQEGVTLFMGLQAALQTVLHRYSRQDDIVISAGVGNREQTETEGLIGCFINTVLLRTSFLDDPTFRHLLKQVRQTALKAAAHQEMPFELLVQSLKPQRFLSHNPLAQVMIVLLTAPKTKFKPEGLQIAPVNVGITTSQLDLTLHAFDEDEGLHGVVTYNCELFNESTIGRMMRSLVLVISEMGTDPEQKVSTINLLTPEERRIVTEQWNATQRDFPADLCLHERIELQVEHSPEAPAVIFGDQELSYFELDRRANRLAWCLKNKGVRRGDIVALCMDRSIEMIVGMLGTMKAGAAYTPLDPIYPAERIGRMLAEADAKVLLTQSWLKDATPKYQGVRICIDQEPLDSYRTDKPVMEITTDDLAYVIYTSGSTGTPKGIEIRHGGVTNNIMDLNRRYAIGPGDRVLALSSPSFDMSVYELFGMLECGATVVVPAGTAGREPMCWAQLIRKHRVTIWNSAPALLKMFMEIVADLLDLWPSTLRLALLGGDWVSLDVPGWLKRVAPGIVVTVMGGATEASIHSTLLEVETTDPLWRSIPYGRPMANQKVYVLHQQLELAPLGVAGELHLGGVGLARGYCHQPELTARKFIPNPFATEPGERMYKTGDLVKWSEDGVLELLGRVDFLVKIRGFRIELGDVEAALRRCKGVRDAVVVVRENDDGKKFLIGYVVTGRGEALNAKSVRSEVKEHLPDYMVPAVVVVLEKFPLSPNGKIDRPRLPKPTLDHVDGTEAVLPRTALERVIAGIWIDVLQLPEIGVHDNFFDSGGHSLLVARVAARAHELLGLEVPVRTLFENPTVAQLADWLEKEGNTIGKNVSRQAEVILEVLDVPEDSLSGALAQEDPAAARREVGDCLLWKVASRGIEILARDDPALYDLLNCEYHQQTQKLSLVAASGIADPSVLACGGSVATNVTTEGYPGRRFHGGCEFVDQIEELAVNRAKAVFKACYANVQPHSGTSANEIVLFSVLKPGDTILGMDLKSGGHLTHGAPVSVSGCCFRAIGYGVNENGVIDYDEVARMARECRPRLIVAGASSYPRTIDFKRFREIADEVDAYLLADISHIAGLVAAGEHPNPIDCAHFTTTSTYKQLCGPRGGLILMGKDFDRPAPDGKGSLSDVIQRTVFPYFQGTPNLSAITAKARALAIVSTAEFKRWARAVVDNARTLAEELMLRRYRILTGGSDNHMVLVDVAAGDLTGVVAEKSLGECNIVVNKNRIPGDPRSAMITSGLRLGTNALTTRGMRREQVVTCAELIHQTLSATVAIDDRSYTLDPAVRSSVQTEVLRLSRSFPIPDYPLHDRST